MKIRTNAIRIWLLMAMLLLPAVVSAQFTFTTNNGAINITGYNTAAGLNVVIPAAINGYPVTGIAQNAFVNSTITNATIPNSVTSIAPQAFQNCFSLTSLIIGRGVTSIGSLAFFNCNNLTTAYFLGNAPEMANAFFGVPTTIYYLPGTTGWGIISGSLTTGLWYLPSPLILSWEPTFGVQTNNFGFTISWATNTSVVIVACTNLANPVWVPVSTNTLVNGTSYFSDPQWTNYPGRFYSLRSP